MGKSRKMAHPSPVLPHVFKALERADMIALSNCKEEDIRPILPCLVRMSLIAPIENTLESSEARKAILKILSGIETVNSMVALLSVDFVTLESDIKKEQQLRQKAGGTGSGGPQEGGVLIPNLINGLALEFECSEPLKRLRLLLSEIIFVMAQVKEARPSGGDWFHKECELFDNLCYFEEISDILSIGVSELPGLLNPGELAETLLHFSNAPHLISRIVANQADYFKEVLTSLIINGEVQDEETDGGLMRLNTIRTLCQMNPTMSLHARNLCIENCRMPGLAIYLTLDAAKNNLISCDGEMASMGADPNEVGDVVSFVTGLLLSPDQAQRSWFSNYIKNTQKRKYEQPHSGLSALRSDLSERLCALQVFRTTHILPAPQIIPAVALLRLYTALKNLPAIKLQEDKEVGPLLQLLTCQPPISASGVRFVSTGLCVLIACPQLLNTQENERKATEWIKWLVKEEVHFSGALGIWSSNFGALLLLVAIHFHVGQLSAILDLVSSSLGMKVMTRPNNLQTIKRIITQEVFTESVITSIAAKVSVTKALNASMPGFLPAHCVFHLLKSRMFSRHKVNIKNWIYKQICSSKAPIHPILPQLIEVFVKSIVSSNSAVSVQETTNDPITESEILAVFQLSSFSGDRRNKAKSLKPKIRSIKSYSSLKHSVGDKSDCESFGASSFTDAYKKTDKAEVQCVLTSQLLLLYYLLLYEDLRVSSGVQASQHSSSKVITYSPSLFSQLPIRYLLSRAQKDQAKYAGLYSALLKLMAHHYPQLCLAQDWLYKPASAPHGLLMPRIRVTSGALLKAMSQCASSPGLLLALLEKCLLLPSFELWSIAAVPLTSKLVCLLQEKVPRSVLDKYVLVWRRLNSIYPRRLWAMTVEGLRSDTLNGHCSSPPIKTPKLMGGALPRKSLTEDDLVLDPLYVLRCDQRVFRRAPLLQLVVYMLEVYLLSSRTFLTQHQQSTVSNMPGKEEERDKLRGALILTQESAAMQILIESVCPDREMECSFPGDGAMLCQQEVHAVVFSYLHQTFIKDTTLSKLVHFQGYPRELLGPVVQGVPSMHVAVAWVPELLQLPHHQHNIKQHSSIQQLLFTLELTARLSSQNALPSTMSIARLIINVISTLISVLSSEGRLTVVRGSMTPLVTLGAIFYSLLPDIVNLLHSFARLARAHCSIQPAPANKAGAVDSSDSGYDDNYTTLCDEEPMDCDDQRMVKKDVQSALEDMIVKEVTNTFSKLSEAVCSDSSLY